MHTTLPQRWNTLVSPDGRARSLAGALQLPETIAALLIARGIDTDEAARAFLAPQIEQLHAPALMLGMSAAAERLRAALAQGEPVLIYGDYDVDGTIATVLLKTALERAAVWLGTTADVRYHIPHRLREGYGIQTSRIEAAAGEGVRLVVSVDTGIRAFAAAEEAERVGLDLIVTDHHLPDAQRGLPRALAVLNPNQPDCSYPCKELCGAAVSFKLAQAVLEACATTAEQAQILRTKLLPSFLKLLAIATIADSVPLCGENRTIAVLGLRELRHPTQPGLRALMDLAGLDLSEAPSAMDVGFRIAPRINAAGRMDIASDVVEMFLTRDAVQARTLAEKLHRLNDDRRASEAEALQAIEAMLDAMAANGAGLGHALVLDDGPTLLTTNSQPGTPGWHRGVLGILASRVVDRTGLPALVLTHEGDGMAHGSGRSVEGFHLLDALTAVQAEQPIFARFGGHAHAVGFALPSEHVPTLRERLGHHASTQRRDVSDEEILHCDAELTLAEITPAFLAALEKLGPFGNGNPEPTFLTRNVRLAAGVQVIKQRHLRLAVEDADSRARFHGVAWSRNRRGTPDFSEQARVHNWTAGDRLDLVYRLSRNRHPDFAGWEMEIVAVRSHAAHDA